MRNEKIALLPSIFMSLVILVVDVFGKPKIKQASFRSESCRT